MCNILLVAHSYAGWLLPVLFKRYSPDAGVEFLTREQNGGSIPLNEIERRSESADALVLGTSRQSLVSGEIAEAEGHAARIFIERDRKLGIISLEASCLGASYLRNAALHVRAVATFDLPQDERARFPNAHFVHLYHVPENQLRGFDPGDKDTRCEWIARNLSSFTKQLLAA